MMGFVASEKLARWPLCIWYRGGSGAQSTTCWKEATELQNRSLSEFMAIHILVILRPRALARRPSPSVAAGHLIPLDSSWNDMRLRPLRPSPTCDSYNDVQLYHSCLALTCDS